MVPPGVDQPQRANFLRWSELIADYIAPGKSNENLRGYLKAVAGGTWPLVQWLTHAGNATRFDAEMALDAAERVLGAFGMALVRKERGVPDRCPICGSYQITTDFRPDLDIDPPYLMICKKCGWVHHDAARSEVMGQHPSITSTTSAVSGTVPGTPPLPLRAQPQGNSDEGAAGAQVEPNES